MFPYKSFPVLGAVAGWNAGDVGPSPNNLERQYEFQYELDGSGELYLDNRLVIDREKGDKGSVDLSAGAHPLRLAFCGKGGATISLVEPDGKRRELVPQDLQPKPPKAEASK